MYNTYDGSSQDGNINVSGTDVLDTHLPIFMRIQASSNLREQNLNPAYSK